MALRDVFAELAAATDAGVFDGYAIGGAIAAAFYLEPTATHDVEVFVTIPTRPDSSLLSLESLYAFFRSRGAVVEGERLVIGEWLVQLLPAPTPLVEDALSRAILLDVEGQDVRVFTVEHLAAIALETNRLKDKARLRQFQQSSTFDENRFQSLIDQFGLRDSWDRFQQLLKESP